MLIHDDWNLPIRLARVGVISPVNASHSTGIAGLGTQNAAMRGGKSLLAERLSPSKIPASSEYAEGMLTMNAEFLPADSARVTIHLRAAVHRGLKLKALHLNTSMSALIRAGIESELANTAVWAEASMSQRRTSTASRTTVDLPMETHRTLKIVAAQHDTSIQALIAAAIVRRYPELTT